MRTQRVLPFVVAVLLAAAACGGGSDKKEPSSAAPPPKVPTVLVPPSLVDGTLTLTDDRQARKTFSKLGERALVADGGLWQVRQGDRLVATLQIATVKTKVDLTDAEQRRAIVRHILPGSRQDIDVEGVTVSMSEAADKTIFVWFARDLFQVMQVKTTKLDPEKILSDLVAFQVESPAWRSLPAEDDEA